MSSNARSANSSWASTHLRISCPFPATNPGTLDVYGAFGALDRIDSGRGRSLDVEVRVGDYKFDNTGSSSSLFYNPYEVFSESGMALDNDYDSIRRTLWLLSDGRYKRATEDL